MDDLSSPTSLNLNQKAINAALNCLWEDALKLNKEILKKEPRNVDALSRYGRACFELGKLELSKKYYNQVLKVDPYNPIAIKNLKILKASKEGSDRKPNNHGPITPNMFLHEPGKTKVVTLLKVAEPQKLANLYPGMPVELINRSRTMSITDAENQYLGVLPDDISFLLAKMIKGGNKYQAVVKSVRVNGLSILIRESFRANRFKNRPSFQESGPMLTNHISHAGPIIEAPESNEEEDEESN